MLNRPSPAHRRPAVFSNGQARQGGVVLLIALIILVALSLGGIALVRSIDTTNLIAGNLAFQKSAMYSGEAGTEDAINFFLEATIASSLQSGDSTKAYTAATPVASTGYNPPDWDAYWASIDPAPLTIPVSAKSCGHGGGRVCTLPTELDAAGQRRGNTVSYTIQRLCEIEGDPRTSGCANAAKKPASSGASLASGSIALAMSSQYYYRVTTRTVGPRNTVSYIQTIVAR